MELILVRHGETDWNVAARFRGRADIALNERGLKQASATAQRIAKHWKPAAIYASPVPRAAQTAARIGTELWLDVKTDDRLSDIDYGAWEGLTRGEVADKFPGELAIFDSTPSLLHIPKGDDFASVRQRVAAFLFDVEIRHGDERIVVVGHTEINRILLLIALRLPTDALWRIEQHPCAISVLRVTKQRWTVVTMNDICHLETIGG